MTMTAELKGLDKAPYGIVDLHGSEPERRVWPDTIFTGGRTFMLKRVDQGKRSCVYHETLPMTVTTLDEYYGV